MKKFLFSLLFISVFNFKLFSQTPDWSTSIAAIIYANCSSCHHEDGIAPFPLMSYEDAILNGSSIQAAVNALLMPPWPPDPNYSHFRDEKVLSASDLAAINNWVDGGMPSGNLSLTPPPPVFNGLSLMQQIDDTVHLPQYTVNQEDDEYRTFVVHS